MRVLVCTIVHHPADARIYHRQIRALLDAGHEVRYVAPFKDQNLFYPERTGCLLQVTPVPRAVGRRRLGALLAARRELARHCPDVDLLLVHDPELLLALPPRRSRPPAVWDVHEDTAAALSTKPWLPRPLRPAAAVAVRAAERLAERHMHLILAEHGYVPRFARPHPVVPNTTYVPDAPSPPGDPGGGRRVVYLGHLSPDRGVGEMIELAALLRPHGIAVELIGPADARARTLIESAADLVRWHGFVPNDRALPLLDGALAGLSLLHDEPNFRHSLPTKVVEYMARGVPVITTPLPAAAELATAHECGLVVPFADPHAAAGAILELAAAPALRAEMGRRGHAAARSTLGWPADARAFVSHLESWARPRPSAPPAPFAPMSPRAPARPSRPGPEPSSPHETGLSGGQVPMKPGFHGVGRRLRRLVADNRWFVVALGAGAVLRVVAMLGYPGALWFAGDSYVYLGAALRLRPNLSKTTGYSLFLRAFEPLHSLTLVTAVQHLMGLAVAVMVYALARRWRVPQGWATAAALPVLLDGFVVEDEHLVMAEALFTFLIVLAMALIVWRDRVPWQAALAAGLLAGYAVDVRSEGLPVLVLFPVFLVIRAGRDWRRLLAAGVMAAGCAVPVLAYAAWFHSWYGGVALTRSDGFYLWGRMSSFADCQVIKPPAAERKVCPSGPPSSRTPPGDYIWHAPQVRHIAGGPVSAANDALLRDFALRAVVAQPLGYLRSVLGGLALSVEWPRRPYPDPGTVYFYYFHLRPPPLPAGHSWIPGGTAYSDAVGYGHAAPVTVVRPLAKLIAGYQRVVYTYGPLFGLILLTGLGGVVRIQRPRRRPPRSRPLTWSPRTGSMLPWTTAVVLLVFPIAVADFDYRYLLPVLPFASLAASRAFAPARPVPAPQAPSASPGSAVSSAAGADAAATGRLAR